jgi:hypothetical protein
MGLPSASQILQMYAIFQSANPRIVDCVAGLVGSAVYTVTLSAETQHFWHERQTLQFAIVIQSCENLCFTAHFHKLTSTKI